MIIIQLNSFIAIDSFLLFDIFLSPHIPFHSLISIPESLVVFHVFIRTETKGIQTFFLVRNLILAEASTDGR